MYQLDASASYGLSRRFTLTGGAGYNVERDRMSASRTTAATARLYVCTAFEFEFDSSAA